MQPISTYEPPQLQVECLNMGSAPRYNVKHGLRTPQVKLREQLASLQAELARRPASSGAAAGSAVVFGQVPGAPTPAARPPLPRSGTSSDKGAQHTSP